MKVYSYKSICIVILILGVNYGCKKFVDLAPPTIVRTDQYFKTQADLTAAVNGMYSGLRGYYGGFYAVAEIPSDNTQSNGYTISIAPMDQLTWATNNSNISGNWSSSYAIIARANIILDKIDAVSMPEDLKEQYKGEAKFIRALMYSNLVQFFGNIPLVVHEIKTEEEAYSYPQVPSQDVYNQIETDIKDAIQVLPTSYSTDKVGKATKGAAQSLLGKVLVTNKQFTEAIPVLKEVINSPVYSLLSSYADVFSVKKNNAETIFSVQYLGNSGYGEGSQFSIAFAPFGSGEEITSGGQPASANEGTLDLYNAFESGDLRKNVAIVQFPVTGVYYTRKYLDKPMAGNEGGNNWIVMRYADVLLLYAEALNETGATEAAIDPLNEVRDRADIPLLSGMDQNSLRTAIQQERRVELCFEGHRWFDLLRTETMLSTMAAYKEKYLVTGGYQVGSYEVTPNKVLFPIPFNEISLNPKLVQNDGY